MESGTRRPAGRDGPGLAKRMDYESTRISSQHERLNQLYRDLIREIDRGARHNAIVCFGRMRDSLEAHFEIEDRVYFPAVRGFLPERSALLDRLAVDHEEFRTELTSIERLLEVDDLDETDRVLAAMVERLRAHEAQEDALLVEVSSRPSGADGSSGGR